MGFLEAFYLVVKQYIELPRNEREEIIRNDISLNSIFYLSPI